MRIKRGIGVVYVQTGQTAQHKRKARFVMKPERIWRMIAMYKFFSPSEELLLHRLSNYMSYENAIAHNGERLSPAQMADLLHMDRSQFSRTMKGLIRKNAIGVWMSGGKLTYYVNPELYRKGDGKRDLLQKFAHEVTTAQGDGAKVFDVRYASRTLLSRAT